MKFGLVVIEVITPSGHLSNINEIIFLPSWSAGRCQVYGASCSAQIANKPVQTSSTNYELSVLIYILCHISLLVQWSRSEGTLNAKKTSFPPHKYWLMMVLSTPPPAAFVAYWESRILSTHIHVKLSTGLTKSVNQSSEAKVKAL